MIRALSSIIVLVSLTILLILPALLWLLHTSMSHHDMDISSCLEHCLGNEKNSNFQELTNNIKYSIKIIVNQIRRDESGLKGDLPVEEECWCIQATERKDPAAQKQESCFGWGRKEDGRGEGWRKIRESYAYHFGECR